MRDHIIFYLNGERRVLRGRDALLPVSRYLRERERLTGTKIACDEGACGACTILLGTPQDHGGFDYAAVNACLLAAYQLDGRHLLTVEGIAQPDGALSLVQEAMVGCHGTQCGFCTPGVVMALTAIQMQPSPGAPLPGGALTGNLCRCTGYQGIREAAERIVASSAVEGAGIAERYPVAAMIADLARTAGMSFLLEDEAKDPAGGNYRQVFAPTTVAEAVAFLAERPGAVVMAGGTEVTVDVRAGRRPAPSVVLWLGRIPELGELGRTDDALLLGGAATWTQVEAFAADRLPALSYLLRRFAGPQIKNIGTVAGNIVHGSPIADSLPLLIALGAQAEMAGPGGARRRDDVEELSLGVGEILVRVVVPKPAAHQIVRVYKVSGRRAFDRSVVSAAFCIGRNTDGVITDARIAFGGIAPRVQRLTPVESYLLGRPAADETTFRAAGKLAASAVAPLLTEGDTSAGTAYRRQLSANLMMKFCLEEAEVARRHGP